MVSGKEAPAREWAECRAGHPSSLVEAKVVPPLERYPFSEDHHNLQGMQTRLGPEGDGARQGALHSQGAPARRGVHPLHTGPSVHQVGSSPQSPLQSGESDE